MPTNRTSSNKNKSTNQVESGFRILSSSSTPWLRKVQSHSFWRWGTTSPKWWERQIYFRIKSSSYQLALTKSATSKDQRCNLNWWWEISCRKGWRWSGRQEAESLARTMRWENGLTLPWAPRKWRRPKERQVVIRFWIVFPRPRWHSIR